MKYQMSENWNIKFSNLVLWSFYLQINKVSIIFFRMVGEEITQDQV
jgi:hypothetical protein